MDKNAVCSQIQTQAGRLRFFVGAKRADATGVVSVSNGVGKQKIALLNYYFQSTYLVAGGSSNKIDTPGSGQLYLQ